MEHQAPIPTTEPIADPIKNNTDSDVMPNLEELLQVACLLYTSDAADE